jgi:hypothetical protein
MAWRRSTQRDSLPSARPLTLRVCAGSFASVACVRKTMTMTTKHWALPMLLSSLSACGASSAHEPSLRDRPLVLIPLHQAALDADAECGCPDTRLDRAEAARARADAYTPSLLAMAAGFDPNQTVSNPEGLAACLDEVRGALADCSDTRLPRACELDRILRVTGSTRDASPSATGDFARAAGGSCSADFVCAEPLRCIDGRCAQAEQHGCVTSAECGELQVCVHAEHDIGRGLCAASLCQGNPFGLPSLSD